MKTSGLVVLSNPVKYGYPFRESIESFKAVCDEIVVAYNVFSDDDSRKEIEKLGVRIVPTLFDLQKYGWLSYAAARTTGYQACKGDVVFMFDADGILHEKDVPVLKRQMAELYPRNDIVYGFWQKYRCYSPTRYWDQHKHSGWYFKSKLQDNFDFYHTSGKGIPNYDRIPDHQKRGVELDVKLYGYEHVWDTREAMMERVTNYGKMHDRQHNKEFKTTEDYFTDYVIELEAELKKKSKVMKLEDHPKIIQDRLKSLTPDYFGYDFFGRINI